MVKLQAIVVGALLACNFNAERMLQTATLTSASLTTAPGCVVAPPPPAPACITPTPQAQALHDALIARGIKCELEKDDGHKHIDIAITWAKLNIEIDGIQHYTNPQQITSDYQRTYYSMKKGYKTLRYPNFVIEKYLDTVADAIAKLARGEYYKTHANFIK
jgi:very-short-patch-repair endonuclease